MKLMLVAAWLVYFILHSWLAGFAAKQHFKERLPQAFPRYRLLYNLISAATLLPVLLLIILQPGELLWHWQGPLKWFANSIGLAAIIGFAYSMRFYDGKAFLGITPDLENRVSSAGEPFTLSPLHRYVRHPWYACGLLFIWTRDMNEAWLISSIMITAYLFVGSRLEDRKLIAEYGSAYQQYAQLVPAILPFPGRSISAAQASAFTTANK